MVGTSRRLESVSRVGRVLSRDVLPHGSSSILIRGKHDKPHDEFKYLDLGISVPLLRSPPLSLKGK